MANVIPIPVTGASALVVRAGVTTIPGESVGGTPAVYQSVSLLAGWSLVETTGAAGAKVRFRDGTTVAGPILAEVTIASGGPPSEVSQFNAAVASGAIFMEVVSGSIEGSVEFQ